MMPNPALLEDETPDARDVDEHDRRLIRQAFGDEARIRLLRQAPSFGATAFVVDLDKGPQHIRLVGTFAPVPGERSGAEPGLVTMSAMDLIRPARLILDYARLMSFAFSLSGRRTTALMLGVGGGDMWRFVRDRFPECVVTLVEFDETMAEIARRWFYLDQPVIAESGVDYIARATEKFDTILVDVYDSNGPVLLNSVFWSQCLDALAPGGCLACNWPHASEQTKAMGEALAAVAANRGHACFYVAPRDLLGNIIQFVPTIGARDPVTLAKALQECVEESRGCEGDRPIMDDCVISPTFPMAGSDR